MESIQDVLLDRLGVPRVDLERSTAAASVGRLADASQLFVAHFEHRFQLAVPEHWNPEGRDDLKATEHWDRGVFLEKKYATFRHDRLIGSFHPMHRGKWTAHELCHGLVGFGWHPRPDVLFNSLAARLAEVLPVALWYFFDEADLERCPHHQGKGPLGRTFCGPCELAAARGARPNRDTARWMADGVAFVEAELTAVRRSQATGELVPHRHGDVDLSSDAIAYALAHAPRLGSEEFEIYAELFFQKNKALHRSLEALEERVRQVMGAILDGSPLDPLSDNRWEWVAQDIGWRLLTISSECTDDIRSLLRGWVGELASDPGPAQVTEKEALYRELVGDFDLPLASAVFAVGYDLPGGKGRSQSQISEGIISACPAVSQIMSWRQDELAAEFMAADDPLRMPIGRRFAAFLESQGLAELAILASFESALLYPPIADQRASQAPGDKKVGGAIGLKPEVSLLRCEFDFVRLADSLRHGRPMRPSFVPTQVAIGHREDGDAFIAELPLPAYEALKTLESGPRPRRDVDLVDSDLTTLERYGILTVQD